MLTVRIWAAAKSRPRAAPSAPANQDGQVSISVWEVRQGLFWTKEVGRERQGTSGPLKTKTLELIKAILGNRSLSTDIQWLEGSYWD